jgi:hypothetical protein
MKNLTDINRDFKCIHCRNFVSAGYLLAGVNNRNHCPYCLWSRHMDLFKAGDRMSACKGPMEPVGLTMKRGYKKYKSTSGGELMLAHLCADCEQISINRIAADDDAQGILAVFNASAVLGVDLRDLFQDRGISLLGYESAEKVMVQLFGQHSDPIYVGAASY